MAVRTHCFHDCGILVTEPQPSVSASEGREAPTLVPQLSGKMSYPAHAGAYRHIHVQAYVHVTI